MQQNIQKNMHGMNWIGLQTLAGKEVGRFLNVYTQTLIAPIMTTLLFFAVFALAFGGAERSMGDVPYMQFLAPGLVMMTMVQNAFANTSSSIVISKVQRNIVDVLMPPLSPMEMLLGYTAGGVLRGLAVGVVTLVVMSFFTTLHIHAVWAIVSFAFLGTLMLSLIGILGGLWSEKFDHIAMITNFVVTPLAFLSGTFYSIDRLPPFWQDAAHADPFFYMIDGFRYGFIGVSDSSPYLGLTVLILVNVAMFLLAHRMLVTGYKIKQ
jgi:ABC-2 type transport system permease protein